MKSMAEQIAEATHVRIFRRGDVFHAEMYKGGDKYWLLRDEAGMWVFSTRLAAYSYVLQRNPDIKVVGEDQSSEHISFVADVRASLARTESLLQVIAAQQQI